MARITSHIHSLEGMEHPFGIGIVPYLVEERGPDDLTLIDTAFLAELPKLEEKIRDEGYDISNVKRLVLTHTHIDHVQAANEIRRISGARIYSHWIEAGYLAKDPPYHGPPNHEAIKTLLGKLGMTEEAMVRKFGAIRTDPTQVDEILKDGDSIGSLKVIHSPGHTPGHMALYCEEERTLIGGDSLFNTTKLKDALGEEGLFVPDSVVSLDPMIGAVSARRISRLHFDKLLLGHQDAPILEAKAPRMVEQAANSALQKKG